MIYTNLAGRCGNQLFSYAITRKLQIECKDQITFCDYKLLEQSKIDETFINELTAFKTVEYNLEHTAEKPVLKFGNIFQKMAYIFYLLVCRIPYRSRPNYYKRQERFQPFLNFFGIYDLTHGYSPLKYSKMKNKFINGYYEDKRWFDDIRCYLLEEIVPKNDEPINKDLYDIILSTESVCVSIRRGDFLNCSNRGLRDICNEDYFRKSIAKMVELKPNAVFIFFSDEVDWVKNNYDFGVPSYYETGNDDVTEKLRLMCACKNFIVSNSTFSWWAQYLSTNEDKIVISPDRWFNMPGYKHQLIDDQWLLILCE